jgi:hypothetical protein
MGPLTFGINVTPDGCVDRREGIADDETHAFFTRPGRPLLLATAAVAAVAVALPFTPLAALLGPGAPSPALLATVGAVTALYGASSSIR